MEKNESLTGRCICGQVKYRITEKPLFTQACHCKDCKIITGSSYVINTSVLDNTLIIEGNISSTELKTGSGATSRAYFCNKCGTYIYTDYATAVGRSTVRTKTLDNSENFPPEAHIFTKDKDPWLKLTDDANCFEKMYDLKNTWPKESYERYKNYLLLFFKYSPYLFKLSSGHVFFGSYIFSKQITSSVRFNHGSLSFVKICTCGG